MKVIRREINCKLIKKSVYFSDFVTYCYCRIIESFKLEKTSTIIESNCKSNAAKATRSTGKMVKSFSWDG